MENLELNLGRDPDEMVMAMDRRSAKEALGDLLKKLLRLGTNINQSSEEPGKEIIDLSDRI